MRGRSIKEGSDARPTCYDCMRPQDYCVCSLIPPFTAHCNFLILQHPHERKKYYSTVKLLKKTLLNAQILRGVFFSEQEILERTQHQSLALLYPSPSAIPANDIALNKSDTVIVLDGTWDEAGKILFRNPFLHSLRKISFSTPHTSEYRIRKQPRPHYLSTLESIGHFLRANAPISRAEANLPHYEALFSGFTEMVNRQLAHFPRFRNKGTYPISHA